MAEALYACRFVQFTAAMMIFGTASFRLFAVRRGSIAGLNAWSGNLMFTAALVALVSAVALLLCQSSVIAASAAAAMDPSTIRAALFEPRFGRVWSWHLLIALLLVLACIDRQDNRQAVVLILSLMLLAGLALIGHAAMGVGAARTAHEINQIVHLLAAGVWLGGLMPVGWLLRQGLATGGDAELAFARDALRHCSQMGYATVALLALTGALNSLVLIGSFEAMFGTAYGRLLAFKIMVFVAMVVAALVNRFRLVPRIVENPAALRALCRNASLEQELGCRSSP